MTANNLHGQVAVVTGGAGDIGRASCFALARDGAYVVVADINAEKGAKVVAELTGDGYSAAYHHLDVTEEASVVGCFADVVQLHGHIDILVAAAGITGIPSKGINGDGPIDRVGLEAFDAVFSVNIRGLWICVKVAAEYMIAQQYGRIVLISSVVGSQGNLYQWIYGPSKAAVNGLARSGARQLGGTGVTINAVAPGFIEGEMTGGIPQKVTDKIKLRIPGREFGQPENVAYVVRVLSDPEGGYINGAVYAVDSAIGL